MERDDIHFEEDLNNFLKGGMSPSEEDTFRALLEGNPDLKQKAVATARLVKAMEQVGEENDRAVIEEIKATSKAEIKRAASLVAGGMGKTPIGRVLHILMISISVAAAVLLCTFGIYSHYRFEQQKEFLNSLGKEYIAYFPPTEFIRGENDSISDKLQSLSDNIVCGRDVDGSIGELSRMWMASRSESYNDTTEYMPVIGWTLANALLLDNEKDEALKILDILIEEYPEDTAVGQTARKLRHKIDNGL